MAKKWCSVCIGCFLLILFVVGSITVIVDPYFHYHAPLEQLEYPLNHARYQNDGIAKHFDYDAIITGTSMTENFKASECDELFGVHAVKISLSGGFFKEVNDQVSRAIQANPNIKMVLRSLDSYMLIEEKDREQDTFQNPEYLYDNNILNDVKYIFNKDVLLKAVDPVFQYTADGQKTTDFDVYCRWNDAYVFSKESVFNSYTRPDKNENSDPFTSEDEEILTENILQNIIAEARKNPEIQFYYFIPPYSVVWWDKLHQTGEMERQIAALERASKMLVEEQNIKLFSFTELFEITENLDNYKDTIHYSEDINSLMLKYMQKKEFLLTKDNYQAYWNDVRDYYCSFDFDEYLDKLGYGLIQ